MNFHGIVLSGILRIKYKYSVSIRTQTLANNKNTRYKYAYRAIERDSLILDEDGQEVEVKLHNNTIRCVTDAHIFSYCPNVDKNDNKNDYEKEKSFS